MLTVTTYCPIGTLLKLYWPNVLGFVLVVVTPITLPPSR